VSLRFGDFNRVCSKSGHHLAGFVPHPLAAQRAPPKERSDSSFLATVWPSTLKGAARCLRHRSQNRKEIRLHLRGTGFHGDEAQGLR
jgi:hypothetical protein